MSFQGSKAMAPFELKSTHMYSLATETLHMNWWNTVINKQSTQQYRRKRCKMHIQPLNHTLPWEIHHPLSTLGSVSFTHTNLLSVVNTGQDLPTFLTGSLFIINTGYASPTFPTGSLFIINTGQDSPTFLTGSLFTINAGYDSPTFLIGSLFINTGYDSPTFLTDSLSITNTKYDSSTFLTDHHNHCTWNDSWVKVPDMGSSRDSTPLSSFTIHWSLKLTTGESYVSGRLGWGGGGGGEEIMIYVTPVFINR